MSEEIEYQPPKVWSWDNESGGRWGSTNRPVAGATHKRELPVGKHPLQLYSLATPNGQKVTIMLEELLALGFEGAEYDAHLIRIDGEQFGSGFTDINPNSKIPAMMDYSANKPFRVFESGSILLHLAEKFGALIPNDAAMRAECLSWLFWQMGSAPFFGGGFGHFFAYAPVKIEYAIDRYTMETKRLLDVMNRHLAENQYFCGDEYSIADIAIWPWFGPLVTRQGRAYPGADDFLDVDSYTHLVRWAQELSERPALQRGRMVNNPTEGNLVERHDASDFELKRLEESLGDPRPKEKSETE